MRGFFDYDDAFAYWAQAGGYLVFIDREGAGQSFFVYDDNMDLKGIEEVAPNAVVFHDERLLPWGRLVYDLVDARPGNILTAPAPKPGEFDADRIPFLMTLEEAMWFGSADPTGFFRRSVYPKKWSPRSTKPRPKARHR